MKILRVISTMDPKNGGPCQGIRNSIPALKAIGVENEVLCFDVPGAAYLGKDPFTIHTIGPAKGPYAYCSNLHSWLEQHIAAYDIIIIHGLWLYNSYGVYSFWKKYKQKNGTAPRLYVMPHGMLDPWFQRAKERRVKAIRNSVFWHLIEKYVINGADGILFTCEQELLLARETFNGYKPQRELNIGYGISKPPAFRKEMTEAFEALSAGLNSQPYLLFLSRVDSKKGVDLLVTAYLAVEKKGHKLPALVIAGPGMESEYGKQLQELAKGAHNILFTGMLGGDAKWGAFYGCECFVLPSHQENFGIAVVEAMACGKPVLISNQVNIWKEISAAKAGLVANDNAEGVKELLEKWIAFSNEEKQVMGSNAQNAYQTYYDVEQAALAMKQVLTNKNS
ncbi:Glycosyltransferase involved in cell wall bisynthesis [Filimonas lacunae]|uniref:Glycosyltransferase involved in cell wall bisynthesis n=1 Tax=Filimonas lacunae TaxID=477680 RepID=A0A173M9U6_9BACT|nr:glycosyltransferase [Filimonas lacunae]BAV04292.1 glycosyl transferase, group 1 [Filimonas lacunae]SIT30925.1 Glycosyltransferase involved in cell wall bisynthesis [Filimonas lacunae]